MLINVMGHRALRKGTQHPRRRAQVTIADIERLVSDKVKVS